MDSIEFQKRLFREHAEFALPDFVREIPENSDHANSIKPATSFLGSAYPKRKLTGKDLDMNATVCGDLNRWMLRWMSEDDFIKLCYNP
jgi:hypothetical protein